MSKKKNEATVIHLNLPIDIIADIDEFCEKFYFSSITEAIRLFISYGLSSEKLVEETNYPFVKQHAIIFPNDFLDRIEQYRVENNIKKGQEVFRVLIRKGLDMHSQFLPRMSARPKNDSALKERGELAKKSRIIEGALKQLQ